MNWRPTIADQVRNDTVLVRNDTVLVRSGSVLPSRPRALMRHETPSPACGRGEVRACGGGGIHSRWNRPLLPSPPPSPAAGEGERTSGDGPGKPPLFPA